MKATYKFKNTLTNQVYKIVAEDTSNLSAVEKQKAHSKLFNEVAEKFDVDVLLLKLVSIVIEYQDKFNENKIWVVKKTKCGHYYLNQKIGGNMFYTRFIRVTKENIESVLGMKVILII